MREFEYLPLTYITYSSHTVLLLSQSLWSLSLATHIVYCTKRRKSHVKSIASDSSEYCCRTVRSTGADGMRDRDNDNCSRCACVLVYCNAVCSHCAWMSWYSETNSIDSRYIVLAIRMRSTETTRYSADNHMHAHSCTHTHDSYLVDYETGHTSHGCDFVRSSPTDISCSKCYFNFGNAYMRPIHSAPTQHWNGILLTVFDS